MRALCWNNVYELSCIWPYKLQSAAQLNLVLRFDAKAVYLSRSIPELQMGHMPQEDYAEAIQKTISNFLKGVKE